MILTSLRTYTTVSTAGKYKILLMIIEFALTWCYILFFGSRINNKRKIIFQNIILRNFERIYLICNNYSKNNFSRRYYTNQLKFNLFSTVCNFIDNTLQTKERVFYIIPNL